MADTTLVATAHTTAHTNCGQWGRYWVSPLIGAQVYLEMLQFGMTAVCEFHYVHHLPGGKAHANPAEMSDRLIGAAAQTRLPASPHTTATTAPTSSPASIQRARTR